jgi:hypothetical protein
MFATVEVETMTDAPLNPDAVMSGLQMLALVTGLVIVLLLATLPRREERASDHATGKPARTDRQATRAVLVRPARPHVGAAVDSLLDEPPVHDLRLRDAGLARRDASQVRGQGEASPWRLTPCSSVNRASGTATRFKERS